MYFTLYWYLLAGVINFDDPTMKRRDACELGHYTIHMPRANVHDDLTVTVKIYKNVEKSNIQLHILYYTYER